MAPAGTDREGTATGRLFTAVVAGLICGILAVVLSIGAGSLLFSLTLDTHLAATVGMALAATAVISLVVGLTSSIPGAVAPVQEVPVIGLTAVVVAVQSAMPEGASHDATFVTVVVAVVLSTLVAGIVAAGLGLVRGGAIVRFVPYPVVGGFLAGTGWLIVLGGFGLVFGHTPGVDDIGRLQNFSFATNLGLTLLFVVLLATIEARATSSLVLPGAILITLLIFNLVVVTTAIDPASLHDDGWLVRVSMDGNLWPPIALADLAVVEWRAVALAMIAMPTMVFMTVLSQLMNDTGIELETRADVDLDRELRTNGAANLLAGVVGGMPGFPSVSLTLLARRLGATSRLVGVLVAAVAVGALLLGSTVLDLIPTFLLGGMLIWIGGGLLVQWLFASYRRLDRWEYLVIVLIFGVIVGVGFAQGIFLGLVAAVVLFVIQYGRVDTMRLWLTGRDYQSSAAASEERRKLLTALGDAIVIIRLQGFLFFGTADRLRRAVERYAASGEASARFVLIDFGRVTGIDSSTVLSLTRLVQVAERDGFIVVLSSLTTEHGNALQRGGLLPGPNLHFGSDIDASLRWCEDALLTEAHPEFVTGPRTLMALLTGLISDEAMAARIAPHFEARDIPPDTYFIEQGAVSDDIFLVESGHAAVQVRSATGQPVRLATIGPGAIAGELAYYLQTPRTASVVSEEDMKLWRLSRASIDQLRAEAPEVALALHQAMATMLAGRLDGTNRVLRFMAD